MAKVELKQPIVQEIADQIDGAQSVSHMPTNVTALDADFFVFSGHKVFGPTGIGAVYADRLAARGYDLLLIARRPIVAAEAALPEPAALPQRWIVLGEGQGLGHALVEQRLPGADHPGCDRLIHRAG